MSGDAAAQRVVRSTARRRRIVNSLRQLAWVSNGLGLAAGARGREGTALVCGALSIGLQISADFIG